MHLSGYSSLFELFVVFNLAYAGSEDFGKIISQIVLRSLKDLYQKSIDKLYGLYIELSSHSVIADAEIDTSNFEAQLKTIYENLSPRLQKLDSSFNEDRKYEVKFRNLYLISALFCITVLFISGYSNLCENENSLLLSLLALNIMITIYAIVIFIITLDDNYKRIRPAFTILWFLAFLSITVSIYYLSNAYGWSNHCELSRQFIIVYGVILATIPFLFHFIRVQYDYFLDYRRTKALYKEFREKLSPIEDGLAKLKNAKDLLKEHAIDKNKH